MPVYSHCIYCLEKKLKHFGQQILGWNYQQSLNRQNHTRKILKIYQDFESKSPSIFSVSSVNIIIICIAYKRNLLKYFLSIKDDFISFSTSSGIYQSYHLVECHAAGINSFSTSFFNALHCLNILQQIMSLT